LPLREFLGLIRGDVASDRNRFARAGNCVLGARVVPAAFRHRHPLDAAGRIARSEGLEGVPAIVRPRGWAGDADRRRRTGRGHAFHRGRIAGETVGARWSGEARPLAAEVERRSAGAFRTIGLPVAQWRRDGGEAS